MIENKRLNFSHFFIDMACRRGKVTYMTYARILQHLRFIADSILKQLGPGYSEDVYDNAMQVGLRMAGLRYDSQRDITVDYNGYSVGTARPDFVLFDEEDGDLIVVEVKAESRILEKDVTQVRRYLTLTHAPFGVLINFPKGSGLVTIQEYSLEKP